MIEFLGRPVRIKVSKTPFFQVQGEASTVVENGVTFLRTGSLNQTGLFGTLKNMVQVEGPRYLKHFETYIFI